MAEKAQFIKITIALGFIFGLLLSSKLWISSRFYPLTPIFNILPKITYPFDYILLALLFCLLLLIIILQKPRIFIWLFIVMISFLALLDQSRWQPWAFQYTFMLATLGFYFWKGNQTNNQDKILNTLRLIIASIYFWSGFQKINVDFVSTVFPWMIDPLSSILPQDIKAFFFPLGVITPILETIIGVGLLTKKYLQISVFMAIAMHLFILLTIGPLGHNWNNVIWPWNIFMASFVIILFWKEKNISFWKVVWVKNFMFQKVVLILFGIMPILSFFNLWDSYLSFTLYSGNINTSEIQISNLDINKLPNYLHNYLEKKDDKVMLDISAWAFGELNVPPYPETRIYKNVARNICNYAADPLGVTLIIKGKPTLFNADEKTIYNCSNL